MSTNKTIHEVGSIDDSLLGHSNEDGPLRLDSSMECRHMISSQVTLGEASPSLPRAIDVLEALKGKHISARELLTETYRVIEQRNPGINALCTLVDIEQTLQVADQVDTARALNKPLGPLAGLPIAAKDLAATRGILTTHGSTLFKNHIPDADCLLVERLKQAGAIIIGKTNTPEFGAGSHTFNEVFGATRNPYNPSLTAGGSSGGAAAALSAGLVHLADGSDMGGSLRNPAAYCNVVGMRPSMGRVPTHPLIALPCSRMSVEGPMARTVEDCAFFLSVLGGPDPRDPLFLDCAIQHGMTDSLSSLTAPKTSLRIGWAPNPAGLPIANEVASVLSRAPQVLNGLGHEIEELDLHELADAMNVFKVLRAASYAALGRELYRENPDGFKTTLAQNILEGLQLAPSAITQAEQDRPRISGLLDQLFTIYDYLLMPTTQAMPFEIETEYPTEIDGVEMHSYIDWMSVCCILSPFGLPCLSVPAGFSPSGIPVGLQIVGRPGDDVGVLQLAYAFQEQTNYWKQQPK